MIVALDNAIRCFYYRGFAFFPQLYYSMATLLIMLFEAKDPPPIALATGGPKPTRIAVAKRRIYMSDIKLPSLEELMEAGVHFGHTTSRWHPKMKPFLYGKKGGIHIIDLARTQEQLAKAVAFAEKVAQSGKAVLFVGVKPLAKGIIKEEATRSHSPYAVNRWIGGTLTNWPAVGGMVKRMKQIEDDTASGKLEKYTKKEQLDFSVERVDLDNLVGGLRDFRGTPGALFVADAKYDKTAVAEAVKLGIPVIALTDSNINIGKIAYPIPANDDALKSVSLIAKVIAEAVIAGKEKAQLQVQPPVEIQK